MKTNLISVAKDTAQMVGDILIKHYGNIEVNNIKSASPADVVTKLDTDTENLIAKQLGKYDSSIGFHGEEFGVRKKSNKFWLVDPIDGTAHFIRGIPFCTTMIALVENGEVLLSVIYNFVTKELFEAEKGKGAKLNGLNIHVGNRALKEAYISFETRLEIEKNLKTYLSMREKCIMIHTINCGYEFGLIATGKIDGRICVDPSGKDWDYAPGSLLVSEAGGIVKNIKSESYNYKNHNFIATNKVIYDELTKGSSALF
jgi:myo-inositol-1(or 4)-monophosphatase